MAHNVHDLDNYRARHLADLENRARGIEDHADPPEKKRAKSSSTVKPFLLFLGFMTLIFMVLAAFVSRLA